MWKQKILAFPQGTRVLSLLVSVHQDESEWESPFTFNPSHFLDKDGTFVKRDAFMPFSAGTIYSCGKIGIRNVKEIHEINLIVFVDLSGQRSCLGENLARMELFLFFTSLLQRFRFTSPPGVTEDELDLTPLLGLALTPTPHKLCAQPRHLT